MDWTIDPNADTPPSRQLVERILDALSGGELASGDRLPSVRGLAAEALVNHNTVARAYRDLDAMGVVRGENGRGVFVTKAAPRIARAARQAATLRAFERALNEAVRAGHHPATLRDLITMRDERKSA